MNVLSEDPALSSTHLYYLPPAQLAWAVIYGAVAIWCPCAL